MPKLVNVEDVLSHRFVGVDDADRILRKDISDDEIYAYRLGWNDALEIVAEAEAVDPESLVKHGIWQRGKQKYWNYSCSECGCEISWQGRFCPKCGAKMQRMSNDAKQSSRVAEKTDRMVSDIMDEIRLG